MLSDNTYHADDEAAWPAMGTSRDAMNVRLKEIDKRSVDMLLSGEATGDGLDAAMLERVNSVRRFLSVLQAMPAEEPGAGLADAVLRKVAASQITSSESDHKPSADL